MKNIAAQQLLSNLLQQVEQHLQEAITVLQNLDEQTLLKPAPNGGWSIAQCLEHLNSYGRYYLPEIEKVLNKNVKKRPDTTFKSSWLGAYFTNMMSASSRKKYKAFKNHIPASVLDAHAVVAEFIAQQEKLMLSLKMADSPHLTLRIPISISKLIRLKVGDVFQFVIAHNARHLQQARKNLA